MRKSKKRAARCDVALLVDIETGERGPSGKFVVDCGSVEELLYRCLRTLYESKSKGGQCKISAEREVHATIKVH